ncbi:hypothetical protein CO613_05500 [Lysobacteraceae bacterium NML07-0707]|nr:hypothetical protein CO613_05500 [Xanthomonadaceae bacterium NML07-0707]
MQRTPLYLATAIATVLAMGTAHAQSVTPIRSGQTVEGRLTQNSPKESDGSAYALYHYRGNAGDRILVEMQSNDFDTFLTVGSRTGEDCDDCRRNDDGGEGTNSRLRYTLPANGQVQIRAGALGDDDLGRYSLKISAAPALVAARPQPLEIGREVTGVLGNNSPVDDEERPYQLWTLQGAPNQTLVVRMKSENLDSMLKYGQLNGSDFSQESEDDDGGQGLNSRLRITLDAQGRGAIRATTPMEDNSGSYTISAMVPAPARPPRVSDIDIGNSIRGKLDGNSNIDPEDDSQFNVYRIKGRAGQRLQVRLDSDDFDAKLRWGIFNGSEFILDSEDDDGGGGTNSRLTVTLDASGQGRIVVSALDGSGEGNYTLSVTNAPSGR